MTEKKKKVAPRIISATKISGRKRNRKLFPLYPYLEEGDNVRAGKRQWRGSVLRCKLLPRATVHINPRLAYCFPDQEEIYTCAFVYVYLPIHAYTYADTHTDTRGPSTPTTTSGDEEEEAPGGRSRLYAARSLCAVFVAANGKRRESVEWDPWIYGANAGRSRAKYGAAG